MGQKQLNARVALIEQVSPGQIILRVEPQGWELPQFTPGQFAVLGLPGRAARHSDADREEHPPSPERIIPRAYSVASSSRAREYLEFNIVMVRSGLLTPRLFALEAGDPLWLSSKISGYFTLEDVRQDANIVMLATGTGLAPYMSMLRSYLEHHPRRHMAVVHGARHSCDLAYRDELCRLEREWPRFTYLPVISRPELESVRWEGATGYVQDVWLRRLIEARWGFPVTPAESHLFLCGNPGMIEAMEGYLKLEGFNEHTGRSPGQYHLERYW